MTSGFTLDAASLTALAISGGPAGAVTLDIVGVTNGAAPAHARLVGARLELRADVVALTDGAWQASIPLRASRWGGPALPPPSGSYRLELRMTDAATPVPTTVDAPLPPPLLVPGQFVVAFRAVGGHLTVDFSAPLTDAERGPAQQSRLEADYRSARPAEFAGVFFESFYGQSASCNPLAIDRALAAALPGIPRYWSVVDASIAVPDGAIALVEGSEDWWRIRGSARLLVVNDWLRNRFRARRGQTVLQTWHGTPLKRIALTRAGLRLRPAVATLRERRRWNILLTQNPYSTRIFRLAYAYLRTPWEEGYPRDDVLARGDSAALRAKLGIPAATTVVLYAPTWRDDRPDEVDQLDVAAFTRELGPGYLTLIRGHSRSLRGGSDVHAINVIDVTSYPDASDLFLVSDALVTDYSSVMFDYTVTGKPVYFFTPDLERYRDELRGFYFDLLAVSPGPVVQTAEELVALVRDPAATTARYADRYAAWKRKFNPRDDGGAADRVVRRLVSEGILG